MKNPKRSSSFSQESKWWILEDLPHIKMWNPSQVCKWRNNLEDLPIMKRRILVRCINEGSSSYKNEGSSSGKLDGGSSRILVTVHAEDPSSCARAAMIYYTWCSRPVFNVQSNFGDVELGFFALIQLQDSVQWINSSKIWTSTQTIKSKRSGYVGHHGSRAKGHAHRGELAAATSYHTQLDQLPQRVSSKQTLSQEP